MRGVHQSVTLWHAFLCVLIFFSALFLVGCSSGRQGTGGRPAEGAVTDYSDSAVARRVEAHARYANAILYELEDDTEAAMAEYFIAGMTNAGNEELVLEIAAKFLEKKKRVEALQLLTAATGYATASGEVYARLGLVHMLMGDTNAALVANTRAVDHAVPSMRGYRQLAQMHLQNGDIAKGVAILDEVLEVRGMGAMLRMEFADLYISFWQKASKEERVPLKAKVIAVLDDVRASAGAGPLLLQKLARRYSALGEVEKEAEVYAELTERLPNLPGIRERLLQLYLGSGKHEEAERLLKKLTEDNPTNPKPYYFLGSLAVERNRNEEAVNHFEKVILLDERFEQAYYDLAITQMKLTNSLGALETLKKARGYFDRTFIGETYSALAHSRLENWTNAIGHFVAAEIIARATDTNRLNSSFFFQMGSVYERNKRYEEAETYFRKALELEPEFGEAMNYLGYMWAEQGVRLDEARALIDGALKVEPENPNYLDSLAWVLYKQDRAEEGLEYLLKALELAESPDPTLYDHLGDIYAQLNQMKKARAAWRKALEAEPDNEEIERKLNQ